LLRLPLPMRHQEGAVLRLPPMRHHEGALLRLPLPMRHQEGVLLPRLFHVIRCHLHSMLARNGSANISNGQQRELTVGRMTPRPPLLPRSQVANRDSCEPA
jgi:hypothetical protein